MSIDKIIAESTAQAVQALYGVEVAVDSIVPQTTKKEFEGNLTIVVFPFLKASHKRPEDTAQEIGDYLVANCEAVEKYNVIKGFLNITIKPSFWTGVLQHIAQEPDYGMKPVTDDSKLVMVEYSSPNTNKPLHLGHVRNNLLGYSLAKILEANGNKVVKTNIVNDRGIHICKSMLAWLKWGEGATPESTGKKGDHLIGDYYVLFDQHYKAEVKQIAAEQGIGEEEAEKQSTLMHEAAQDERVGVCRFRRDLQAHGRVV